MWLKNTKSLILEEIMHFVSSNFISMLYKLVYNKNNRRRPSPSDYLCPGPMKGQEGGQNGE